MFATTGYIIFWDDQGSSSVLCSYCYDHNGNAHDIYMSDHDETDSPMHCEECHRPLHYRLTSDGVQYVLNAIVDTLLDFNTDLIGDYLPYYSGSPGTEVVKDWAEDIQWYGGLDEEDEELIEYFLDLVP